MATVTALADPADAFLRAQHDRPRNLMARLGAMPTPTLGAGDSGFVL